MKGLLLEGLSESREGRVIRTHAVMNLEKCFEVWAERLTEDPGPPKVVSVSYYKASTRHHTAAATVVWQLAQAQLSRLWRHLATVG